MQTSNPHSPTPPLTAAVSSKPGEATTRPFHYGLGDQVHIAASDEFGEVIARSEHATCEHQYLIRYADATGRATEQWWTQSALESMDLPTTGEPTAPCKTCGGRGRYREPYARDLTACPDCLTRPISTASATTDASLKPAGSNA